MGFTADTAATTNADFTKYAMEQQLSNLLRDSNTYDDLHKGAVNVLIRDLRGKGYDPSLITNTEDFKAELVYWILVRIKEAQARAGNRAAQDQVIQYEEKYQQQVRTRVYVTASKVRTARRLPMVSNLDHGMEFGPVRHQADGFAQIGRSKIANFDKYVQEDVT